MAIVSQDRRQRCDGFFLTADYFAGDAVLDDLGDRPAPEREDWRATRHGFNHHQPK
jgi:hypothetical protein